MWSLNSGVASSFSQSFPSSEWREGGGVYSGHLHITLPHISSSSSFSPQRDFTCTTQSPVFDPGFEWRVGLHWTFAHHFATHFILIIILSSKAYHKIFQLCNSITCVSSWFLRGGKMERLKWTSAACNLICSNWLLRWWDWLWLHGGWVSIYVGEDN